MSNSDENDPTRDENGRWLPGHCPNKKGRPKKLPPNAIMGSIEAADLRKFANTAMEINFAGERHIVTQELALLFKMFESALKGKVSMQRFMYGLFEKSSYQLAEARARYDQLLFRWYIDPPEKNDPDFEVPAEVRSELSSLRNVLEHYFPGQYPFLGDSKFDSEDAASGGRD